MTIHPKRIYISAGEASGDLLGANLAHALLQNNQNLQLTGMGGLKMKSAGVAIQFHPDAFSIVGAIEIVAQLPRILWTFFLMKRYLKKTKPDLVILIDLPETHLRIAAIAKKLGIPVLYYVSPQIWAWRYHRIKQIKKNVDHMAVLLPFEEVIYQKEKIPVTFVGHPLVQLVKPSMPKELAYGFFRIHSKYPVVALLPGSRNSEIKRHLSIMVEATKIISRKIPDVQFILPLADSLNEFEIRAHIPNHIKVIKNNLYNVLQISNAAIAVSGTVTLEVALMQVPMCILYRFSKINYAIAKRLIRVDHIGLCNIVAQKRIVKEFIQHDVDANNIADEIIKILTDQHYADQIRHEFQEMKNKLGDHHTAQAVAEIACRLTHSNAS